MIHTVELANGRKVTVHEDHGGAVRVVVDGRYKVNTELSSYSGSDGGPCRILRLEPLPDAK